MHPGLGLKRKNSLKFSPILHPALTALVSSTPKPNVQLICTWPVSTDKGDTDTVLCFTPLRELNKHMYALSMMLLILLGLEFSDQQRMDAFDDGFGGEGEVEVDPAAEFLAKEQEELGDIGQYPANYQASGFLMINKL